MSKETNTKQILLPVDFPANHLASQEKEKEQMTIDTSGTKLLESLENANPDGSLAKMLKGLLTSTTAWYSDRCKLTWKKKVSKSNVLLFQLQASVLGIKEKESGLWLTPTATDIGTRSEEAMERRKKYRNSIGRTTVPPGNLAEQVQYGKATTDMYPTPRASAAMTEDMETIAKRNKYNSKLEEKVALQMYPTPTQDSVSERTKRYKQGGLPLTMAVKMFPTPRVADTEGGAVKNVKMENGHFYRENKKGERWGVKLRDAVEMFPTPTARDWKDTGQNSNYKRMAEKSILSGTVMMKQKKVGGKLNPEFVEFLMGYPLNWTKVETTE
jgi:hypothetical protein